MIDLFITSPDDIAEPLWCKLGSIYVTCLPLWDAKNEVFAELTYAGLEYVAKAFGARLPTYEEIDAINRGCFLRLAPETLPAKDMWPKPSMTEAELQAFRVQHMAGLEWAKIHAARVKKQLDAHGLTLGTTKLIANAGKHWQAGAPPGRAYLRGWWVGDLASGHYIQPGTKTGPGPHGANDEHDYGTTGMLIKDDDPTGGLGVVPEAA